jgi:hypothetical protein
MNSKLKKVNEWIKDIRHRMKPDEIIERLNKSLAGYYEYYAVSDNIPSLLKFRFEIIKLLYKWLNRRGQRKSYTWEEFNRFLERVPIMKPSIRHSLYVATS